VSRRLELEKVWIPLGTTMAEAHRNYAQYVACSSDVKTVPELLDRYIAEVVPEKAPGTQIENIRHITTLKIVFQDFTIHNVKPSSIYAYFDARKVNPGVKTARSEIEVLRHAFSKAVEWGLLDEHPFKGEVTLPKNPSRDRYVDEEEIADFLEICNPKVRGYVELKLATGLAKQDLLTIKLSDIKEDGIHAARKKTKGKPKIYEWDDEGVLRSIVDDIRKAHLGGIGSVYLFHTREGKPYYLLDENNRRLEKPHAWDSMWARTMRKWKGEPFTEHDLRAKSASDADNLEHAKELMDHTDQETTLRIYWRAPTRVGISKVGSRSQKNNTKSEK
jgi:integrase